MPPKSPGSNGNGGAPGHGRPLRTKPDPFPLVLIVDDVVWDRQELGRLLGRHGFRSVLTERALDAYQQLYRQPFAAIVADLRLFPGEDDGIAVLKTARECQPDACRILITADPAGAQFAELCGAHWFDKGNTAAGLIALLRSCTAGG